MKPSLRKRFWIEAALAALSTSVLLLTAFRRDWLEAVLPTDADHHSGSFEWLIVVLVVAVTVGFAALARAEWRRPVLST